MFCWPPPFPISVDPPDQSWFLLPRTHNSYIPHLDNDPDSGQKKTVLTEGNSQTHQLKSLPKPSLVFPLSFLRVPGKNPRMTRTHTWGKLPPAQYPIPSVDRTTSSKQSSLLSVRRGRSIPNPQSKTGRQGWGGRGVITREAARGQALGHFRNHCSQLQGHQGMKAFPKPE